MNTHNCFVISLLLIAGMGTPAWGQEQNKEKAAMTANAQPIRPLADDFVTVFKSPDPKQIYAYSPGIARLPNGRLVATLDLGGPGMKNWLEPKGLRYGQPTQTKIFTSDDAGNSWTHRADAPFMHARPFTAGKSLYVLGHAEDPSVRITLIDRDVPSYFQSLEHLLRYCARPRPQVHTAGSQWRRRTHAV